MTPKLELAGRAKTRPLEYGLRFLFGGAVTASTGLVARHFGPAFAAVTCWSALSRPPGPTLAVATLAWLAVSVAAWVVAFGRK